MSTLERPPAHLEALQMAPQDSFIDEDDECWYVISRLSTEPPLLHYFQLASY